MSTVNATVTAAKELTPDAEGKYRVTPDDHNLQAVPIVSVNLGGAIATEDLQADAVTPAKIAEMSADGNQPKPIARATYDFDEHGGAQGDIGLGVTLPDNAVVTRSWYEVITQVTGGVGAEFALKSEATNDILASAVLGTVGTVGFHEGIQDGTAANFVKTTASRELTIEITVADLTAGKFILFCEYVVTE